MSNILLYAEVTKENYLHTVLFELANKAQELAKKLDIEVPVSNAIYEAVYTDITPQALLDKLMNRKLKEEERYV